MNRTEARAMWQRVAEGDRDEDVLRWVQQVAKLILKADNDPQKLGPSQRVYEITHAVGLSKKVDQNAKLRELIEGLEGFYPLEEKDGEVVERPFRRGEEMKILIEWVRTRKLVHECASDPEIRKRIDRIRKPKPARKI